MGSEGFAFRPSASCLGPPSRLRASLSSHGLRHRASDLQAAYAPRCPLTGQRPIESFGLSGYGASDRIPQSLQIKKTATRRFLEALRDSLSGPRHPASDLQAAYAPRCPLTGQRPIESFGLSGYGASDRIPQSLQIKKPPQGGFWALRDSNPRHPRCKRGALTS